MAMSKSISLITKKFSPELLGRISLFLLSSVANAKSSKEGLIYLLGVERHLYFLTGSKAGEYGEGIHPKHVHTKYHDFFVERVSAGEHVLDIGCGIGALASDIVKTGAIVTGIDLSKPNIDIAKSRYTASNLKFICGDALSDLPDARFDTIVLSNVLEHIEYRAPFLKNIISSIRPGRFLIRVPMYERDWRVPLMEEVGIDYRLDDTHFIEYRKSEFLDELSQAGLKVTSIDYIWGEIWCEATV